MSKQKYPQTSGATTSVGSARNIKQNGYSNFTLHANRNRKRSEAEARNAAYAKLSTKEKLKGLGTTGSNRQRARLEALLATEKQPAPEVPARGETTAPKAKGKKAKGKKEVVA